MNLLEIWNAKDAFDRLCALKMPPKLAYDVIKYGHKFMVEYHKCELEKNTCIYAVAGVPPGTPDVRIEPDTDAHAAFVAMFRDAMSKPAELEPLRVSMDALIEGLTVREGNALSGEDIVALMPFFQVEAAKPDLKVVEKA